MAKRFTDSDKWRDPWFCELKPEIKLLWLFILDTCDHAGIWKDQFKYFNYLNETNLSPLDLDENFRDRIFLVSDSTYFIPKFIHFQYPNFNPYKNNAHKGVVKSLTYHGASEGLIEGLVCNPLEMCKKLGASEGLARGTGIGIGLGLGIGIGKGLGIGKGESDFNNLSHMTDEEIKRLQKDFMKGLDSID